MRPGLWITVLATSLALASTVPAGAVSQRALWVWDDPTEAVVEFAYANRVTDIYLYAPPDFSRNKAFVLFVHVAHAHGISVMAAGGEPSWTENAEAWTNWVDEVIAFDRFDGIVFDVEPHRHPRWDADRPGPLLRSYLESLEQAVARAESLPTLAAVPFWWDEPPFTVRSVPMISMVAAATDVVIVMAYRDRATGPDGIIASTRGEAAVASQLGTKFVIGVETLPDDIDKVSFAQETDGYMRGELGLVEFAFLDHPSFAGVAIHDAEGWRDLEP